MMKRDIELLSAYLDGELKPSDSTKLEARLKSEPELASVLNDLRAARTLFRKLPSRKAPRNFTLTRKMVGQNPPLPRTYPLFRYATAVATLLFFLTFGLNSFRSQMASQNAYGMGGGGDVESFAAEAPALEAPAATEAPAEELASEPAEPVLATNTADAEEEPSVALAPQSTVMPSSEDATRAMETPSAKNGEAESGLAQDQSQVPQEAPLVPSTWQIGLAVVALLSALFMVLMRQLSARRWK
jgi:anti-sigma factor RsiW